MVVLHDIFVETVINVMEFTNSLIIRNSSLLSYIFFCKVYFWWAFLSLHKKEWERKVFELGIRTMDAKLHFFTCYSLKNLQQPYFNVRFIKKYFILPLLSQFACILVHYRHSKNDQTAKVSQLICIYIQTLKWARRHINARNVIPSPNYSQLYIVFLRLQKHMWPSLNSLSLTHSSWNALTSEEGERSSARALRSDARTTTCLLVGQRASFIDKNNSERTFEDVGERFFFV